MIESAVCGYGGARLVFLVVVCLSLVAVAEQLPLTTSTIATSSTVVVDCGSIVPQAAGAGTRNPVVLLSWTLYILNCTEAQPAFLDFTANGSGGDVQNIVVHAVGGNVLPRLSVVVASANSSAVHNVSLRMSNVHVANAVVIGDGVPLFAVKGGRSIVGVSAVLQNTSLRLEWVAPLEALFVFGPPSVGGPTGGTAAAPLMSQVSLSVVAGCDMVLRTNVVGGASGAPVLLRVQQGIYPARSVHIAMGDSAIHHSGADSGCLLSVESHPNTVSALNGLQLNLHNVTVTMHYACPSGNLGLCRPNPVDRTGVVSSLLSAEHFNQQQNIAIVLSNVVWNASTPSWDPSKYRVSDRLLMLYLRCVLSRNVSVVIARANATALTAHTAAVLYVRVDACIQLHVDVRQVVANLTATRGSLNASSVARMAGIAMLAQGSIPIDSTVTIEGITAHLFALGGESGVAATGLSRQIMSAASLVSISDGSHNLSVAIVACAVHATVRGGTVPLFMGTPVSSFGITAALMQMLQTGSHTALMVSIFGSAVYASMGCAVNAGATYFSLSSVSAALIATANCSDCTFNISTTTVVVVAVSFDQLPPSASGSAAIGNLNVNAVATLYCTMDASSVMPLVVPPIVLALAGDALLSNLLTTIWHRRTTTNVVNSSIVLAASLERLLVDTNWVVLHLVAVATMPRILTDCTVRIASSSVSVGFELRQREVRLITALLLSFTTSDVARSTFSARDCSGISLLLAAITGALRIEHSTLGFERCAVAGTAPAGGQTMPPTLLPLPVAATPYGSLRDGTVFQIDATNNVVWTVRNSQFNHLDALVDGRSTLLASLALGCNLWDGVALPTAAIGVPLEDVVYPRSVFEGVGGMGGVVCKGIQTQTLTTSVSKTVSEPPETPAPTAASLLPTASTVASVATLVSAVGPVVPRAAVGAMQGVFGLLRLVAACRLDHGANSNDANHETEEEGAAAMDNPLQLSLAIDAPELRYVAGAVVGNTVFVFVVGVVLHGCARGRQHVQESLSAQPNMLQRLVLDLLPRTLWPGCLLVPLGILIEPVVKMAVLLMAFGGAAAGALGGVMLAVWLAVIAFVAFRLLRVRPFPMRASATRTIVKVSLPAVSASDSLGKNKLRLDALRAAVQWATEPIELFAPPKARQHREYAALLEAHYACAYEPYKMPYVAFFVVEYGSAVLVGVLLGAAATVDPSSACSAVQWCGWLVAVLFLGIAAAVVCLSPFVVRSDIIGVALIQSLCAASAVAAALSNDASDDGAAEGLALAASCVELLVVIVGIAGQLANARLRRSLDWWGTSDTTLLRLSSSTSTTSTTGTRRSQRSVRTARELRAEQIPTPTPTYAAGAALIDLVRFICEERRRGRMREE